MLEIFFDNPKVFSFFKLLLNNEKKYVNVPEMLFNLDISPDIGAEMLRDFLILEILIETEDSLETGMFKFNEASSASLAIILFDDIIEKFIVNKFNKEFNNNGENDLIKYIEKLVQNI